MPRTIDDLMTDLEAVGDAAEADRIIVAATAQATEVYHWQRIVVGVEAHPLATRERLAQVVQRMFECALVEEDAHAIHVVARVRVERLDDRHGAYVALEEAIELMRASRAAGYVWVRIAGCFDLVGDPAEKLRCLSAGRELMRELRRGDDLVDVASAWIAIDREAGVALLREAETITGSHAARPWSVSNAWMAINEPAEAWRVLDAAIATAVDTAAAVHAAQAYSCHVNQDGARRALVRAAELATTADHWLDVAEAAYDGGLDVATIRTALQQAEHVATTDSDRARIAMGYKVWLLDGVEAARLGPRGVRPEVPGLFDLLRERATPEILERIASADGFDFTKHLAALSDICETGLVPILLLWEPREVLELTRWSTGDTTDHLARALSCVILCISTTEADELVTNGTILLESCLALGTDVTAEASRFFAGLAGGDDPHFAAVALTLLAVLHAGDAELDDVAARLVANLPDALAETLFGGMRGDLLRELVTTRLVPLRRTSPPIDHLLMQLAIS